jgi:HK97 family phage portal protein
MYMNGKAFLSKIRTKLEIKNTAFIYIQRDDLNHVIGFYPVPFAYFEALEYQNGLFIKFHFRGDATESLVLPWEDLAVLRKDYNDSDISGDENNAILNTLELIQVSNQGISNAVKATANLRGILKSTKAMLSPEDIKKNKEAFVKDYLNLENEGGIASLDATQDFTPITMSPTITNYSQMKEFRENVYRYFGVNDSIVMNDYTEAQMEAFYEGKIEPFLVDLSTELTRKIYSMKATNGFENQIVYEANKLQFATMSTKISVFKEVVLYGGMTINEWRAGCNMAPLEDGDKPIRRLDAAQVDKQEGDEGNES